MWSIHSRFAGAEPWPLNGGGEEGCPALDATHIKAAKMAIMAETLRTLPSSRRIEWGGADALGCRGAPAPHWPGTLAFLLHDEIEIIEPPGFDAWQHVRKLRPGDLEGEA